VVGLGDWLKRTWRFVAVVFLGLRGIGLVIVITFIMNGE
jgi:hypothetical protein